MGELTIKTSSSSVRERLLLTASALTLLSSICAASGSEAEKNSDQPTVWIELGGQLTHIEGQGDAFPVGFVAEYPDSSVLHPANPLQTQKPLPFDFGWQGNIYLQPKASDWVFSAGVNFGRSSNFTHVDHQTNGTFVTKYNNGVPATNVNIRGIDKFADTQVHRTESHAILDFTAGKDFGLGLFGRSGSSIVSLGVRFAQFASKTNLDIRARPNLEFKYANYSNITFKFPYFHTYHLTGEASRSFHGIGPSLAWKASLPFPGSQERGELLFDWGANAALLFGRQRARVQHQESGHYVTPLFVVQGGYHTAYRNPPAGHSTDRAVVIPNVGAVAGVTYRVENFKVSMGYRADFFLGALDGGIDSRKSATLGFFGPFATISVGLGG